MMTEALGMDEQPREAGTQTLRAARIDSQLQQLQEWCLPASARRYSQGPEASSFSGHIGQVSVTPVSPSSGKISP